MTPSQRTQTMLWVVQRASAAVLAACIVVHLITIIYAVRHGLTALEILGRTRGSAAWAAFYSIFVIAAAIHAPIGLRSVLAETLAWRGRSLDITVLVIGLVLIGAGARAIMAVIAA